ncbi:glycine--tRNA ligase [Candidatus Falkowbacteria bacterium RIFOXYD2_FULL_35_9]|uniref:Glycine--tRNA ligase n=1 Tax=Candidatus Falkowbacteria bacterium RIFOXYC2_FULL_36_12 TaxID=1798002 RepID=A0A1F5SYE5_9BACT|nr:MAG: glycine--tRNA ligase [Candidatus Falkowbacteria bacterium RIFOXYB2_FULL_35_7]OGF31747.1 MAG: glycine--tRNA ligase [Candidatus Falkowbacteria bacterium RIFOXYC2_FULL_36_12]OGF34080.1 MAG: glycine--tRNA ligase [Candidatus Falkowbacteria bacterium RIFOXYA2_FULL_35_8]OGF48439.1 MAG: glycine--tRNA ligase [Candidatus Falkowbacteria bacterium RIFOXYD2_FULL_35_9]
MIDKNENRFEEIISFCKRRGFVFPSSEIYGGFSAVYDYGPYGIELKNAIQAKWWQNMVHNREDVVGLDSAIFMSPKVWQASGHVSGFSDPMAECKKCHTRSRVDHLLEEAGVFADEKMSESEINKIFDKNKDKVKCPKCGSNIFSEAKSFNLLVKSNLGNFTGDWDKEPTYLRGETCQGIYINFKNVLDSSRVKIPFGIAQVGKAFRNEITARQFIFRTREFEQMEFQYFVKPEDAKKQYKRWKEERWDFYVNELGILEKNLRWHKHENLVFYAKEAYDIEYNFPFGFKELEGIHNRSDYDLTQHSKHSGSDLSYTDPRTNEKFMPWVIEASVGLNRILLMVICDAYTKEKIGDEERIVLKLEKSLAPVKIAVFPLLKNKPQLVKKAKEIFDKLKTAWVCEFDDNGNVGKRYRRQDEIGTPYCITVDFDSLDDKAVTIRDRDTMAQERVAIDQLPEYFSQKFS